MSISEERRNELISTAQQNVTKYTQIAEQSNNIWIVNRAEALVECYNGTIAFLQSSTGDKEDISEKNKELYSRYLICNTDLYIYLVNILEKPIPVEQVEEFILMLNRLQSNFNEREEQDYAPLYFYFLKTDFPALVGMLPSDQKEILSTMIDHFNDLKDRVAKGEPLLQVEHEEAAGLCVIT